MKEKNDPNKSFVNLTYRCNNRCLSCIMSSRKLQGGKSLNQIKTEIDEILKNSNHIEFNGGEPTLNPHLFKILHYTNEKKENIEITLITNARVFSILGYVNRLNLLGLKNFKIATTLYGYNKKVHDSITRTPHSFEQQICGIQNLIAAGVGIELRIVINKLNYKSLPQMARFITETFSPKDFLFVTLVSMKLTGLAYENRKIVSCRISDTIQYVAKSVDLLVEKGFAVHLFHFPHCLLSERQWYLSEGVTAEASEISFLPTCESCVEKEFCPGVWKSYLDLFGSNEFKPINHYLRGLDVKEIKARIRKLPFDEECRQSETLLFLMGLKRVVRIKRHAPPEKCLSALEGFPLVMDKRDMYAFVSFDLHFARKAAKLTLRLDLMGFYASEDESARNNTGLGKLFGYPICCSNKFYINPHRFNEDYPCVNFFLYDSLPIIELPHIPCFKGCAGTKKLIERIKKRGEELHLNDLFEQK